MNQRNPLRKLRLICALAASASPVAWSTGAVIGTVVTCNQATAQLSPPMVAENVEITIDRARQAIGRGNFTEADALFNQARRANLTGPQADALAQLSRDLETARKLLSPAKPAMSANTAELVAIKLNEANQALAAGNKIKAVQAYGQALPLIGNNAEAGNQAAQMRKQILAAGITDAQIDAVTKQYQVSANPVANPPASAPMTAPAFNNGSTNSNLVPPGAFAPPMLANAAGAQPPNNQQAMNAPANMAAPSLMAPPSGTMPLPATNAPANPLRDQAAALTAQAKLALDKGDLATARRFINEANALRVPNDAFSSKQLKPWEVTIDIERVERQRGIMPASAQAAVVQDGTQQAAASRVQPGIFQPANDMTRVTPAAAAQPTQVASSANAGEELYRQGLDALVAGKSEAALQLFKEAWKYQAELDPGVRAQLRDKLSLLSAPNDTQRTNPATGEPVSAMQAANQEQITLQRKLFSEVTSEIAESERMMLVDPLKAYERIQSLRQRVAQSQVDAEFRKNYLQMVDRVAGNMKAYIDQNRSSIDQQTKNQQVLDQIDVEAATKARVQSEIQELVNQFNQLMEKNDFANAEIVARKVGELDPNSTIATVLYQNATLRRRFDEYSMIRADKERGFMAAMNNVDRAAVPFDDTQSLMFPNAREWSEISRMRAKYNTSETFNMSPAEKNIRERLADPISVNFNGTPLSVAMQTIYRNTGIPIVVDAQGLANEGIRSDQPVTLQLDSTPIQTKSVLNLILEPLGLTYSIADEVLKITSKQTVNRAQITQVYAVKDLVIPIPNFVSDYHSGLAGSIAAAYESQGNRLLVQSNNQSLMQLAPQLESPSVDPSLKYLAQLGQPGNGPIGNMPMGNLPLAAAMMRGSGPPRSGIPQGNPFQTGRMGGLGGAAAADFQSLIDLIQNTVKKGNWDIDGGPDTIDQYANNLSIIVKAPQEVHEEIVDLLNALRKLQNLQVTVEVRFITLTDNFFERIGVDFDFSIDDNARQLPLDDQGKSVSIGLNDSGAPTVDLDFKFNQDSFGASTPQFGGLDASAGRFGFAILSDLELFFLLQAAQGDQRTNVLQAPKVTMFDGQTASVSDFSSTPFVVGLTPVVGDFAVAQQPIIVVLNDGTNLSVQSVVSPDKRSVRVTLVPMFTRIEDRNRTFTFEGTRTSNSGTGVLDPDNNVVNRDNEEEVISGSTVQLPTLGQVNISTTVNIPDGGTILLGGIKRLREGRNERGVPLLSHIPYLNRLFKNVGTGRETTTLMMTVTPHIIIPEEEEEKILGTPQL